MPNPNKPQPFDPYDVWLNDDRTILVTVWNSGEMTVATRQEVGDVWGPPVYLKKEERRRN